MFRNHLALFTVTVLRKHYK